MEITLEKIELVKDRTGVSYAEAKAALELNDGNVVDAIISIEESINSDFEGADAMNFKDSPAFRKMKEIVDKGNISKILVVNKNGDTVVSFPLTVGVLGAVLVPWGAIFGAIAAIGFKCDFQFVDDKGNLTDINGKVVGTYNKAVDAGKKVFGDASGSFEKVKDGAAEKFEKVKDEVAEKVEKVKSSDKSVSFDKVKEGTQETIDKVEEWFKKTSKKIEDEISINDIDPADDLKDIEDIIIDEEEDK